MFLFVLGIKQLNLRIVNLHSRGEGGGRSIFSGLSRGGEQFLKVNRGGGEGYLKVKMKSPELPYPSSIAWSLT